MKVSAALIVKNEERTLGRCLESIRDHVDEIVVVDTGSTDRTEEIARQFTAQTFHFTWRRDFSQARQFAFDRATGDWVFWIDADDVVLNAERIRPSIASAAPEIKAFYWKYIASRDPYGNSTCEFWRERCIRNERLFHWSGRVHEVLVPRVLCPTARIDDVVVLHLKEPKPERMQRRNIDMLHDEYRRSGGRPAPRLLLCLANEYADAGKTMLAIEFLRKYIWISTWNDEKYLAQLKLAGLFRKRRQFDEAEDLAFEAVKAIPSWANGYFSLAETYYFQQDWTRVAHWVEIGSRLPGPDTVCVVNPREHQYDWIVLYTNALYHLGRVRDALAWTEKALAICPSDRWHLTNRDCFARELNKECL